MLMPLDQQEADAITEEIRGRFKDWTRAIIDPAQGPRGCVPNRDRDLSFQLGQPLCRLACREREIKFAFIKAVTSNPSALQEPKVGESELDKQQRLSQQVSDFYDVLAQSLMGLDLDWSLRSQLLQMLLTKPANSDTAVFCARLAVSLLGASGPGGHRDDESEKLARFVGNAMGSGRTTQDSVSLAGVLADMRQHGLTVSPEVTEPLLERLQANLLQGHRDPLAPIGVVCAALESQERRVAMTDRFTHVSKDAPESIEPLLIEAAKRCQDARPPDPYRPVPGPEEAAQEVPCAPSGGRTIEGVSSGERPAYLYGVLARVSGGLKLKVHQTDPDRESVPSPSPSSEGAAASVERQVFTAFVKALDRQYAAGGCAPGDRECANLADSLSKDPQPAIRAIYWRVLERHARPFDAGAAKEDWLRLVDELRTSTSTRPFRVFFVWDDLEFARAPAVKKVAASLRDAILPRIGKEKDTELRRKLVHALASLEVPQDDQALTDGLRLLRSPWSFGETRTDLLCYLRRLAMGDGCSLVQGSYRGAWQTADEFMAFLKDRKPGLHSSLFQWQQPDCAAELDPSKH